MSATFASPTIWQFPAIVSMQGHDAASNGQRARLHYAQGTLDALCWLPAHQLCSFFGCVPIGHVTLVELIPHDDSRSYAIANFSTDAAVPFWSLLPETVCPIEGVVRQTQELVAGLVDPALRAFVTDALSLEGAFPYFWTCPASLRDHHAYAGGLAQHSLEVATLIASASTVPTDLRDVGIAMALLHDLGKVWSYENGTQTKEAQAIGHEKVAYSRLSKAFARLLHSSENLGFTMQALLGGEWRSSARRHPLAIGRVVNAFDQLSCEQAKRGR